MSADGTGDFQGITTTQTNDVIVVGDTNWGNGQDSYYSEALVIKYSSSGEQRWRKTYTSMDVNVLNAVTTTSEGIIAVGTTGAAPDSQAANRKTEALMMLLDEDGDLQWSATYGGSGEDSFNDVAVVGDRLFAITWAFSPDGDFYSPDVIGPMVGEAVISEINLEGDLARTMNFGGSQGDSLRRITSTSTAIIAVGLTGSDDGKLPPTCGMADAAIAYVSII